MSTAIRGAAGDIECESNSGVDFFCQREESRDEFAISLALNKGDSLLTAIKQKYQLISTSEAIREQWRRDVSLSTHEEARDYTVTGSDDLEVEVNPQLEDLVENEASGERIGSIMLDNFVDEEEEDEGVYVPSLVVSGLPLSGLSAPYEDYGKEEEGEEVEEEVIDEEEEEVESNDSSFDEQELSLLMSSLARLRSTSDSETRSEADGQVQPFALL
jgi:hypothetical protein